jgi:hypothetical protein
MEVFSYVNFTGLSNFSGEISSMLVTTYAVPPRGRRPYTGAHFLLGQRFEPTPGAKS